ncbi:MAG: hypothetical protein V3V10_06840 [Planctomycetota bacterium]
MAEAPEPVVNPDRLNDRDWETFVAALIAKINENSADINQLSNVFEVLQDNFLMLTDFPRARTFADADRLANLRVAETNQADQLQRTKDEIADLERP